MKLEDLHGPAMSYLNDEQLHELVTIGVTYLRIRADENGFVDFEPLPKSVVEWVVNNGEQLDG